MKILLKEYQIKHIDDVSLKRELTIDYQMNRFGSYSCILSNY